jgi:hypothetical protein
MTGLLSLNAIAKLRSPPTTHHREGETGISPARETYQPLGLAAISLKSLCNALNISVCAPAQKCTGPPRGRADV